MVFTMRKMGFGTCGAESEGMTTTGAIAKKTRHSVASARRTETLRIGYVPLIDAAPLLVAEAMGYFEKKGLKVQMSRELGWGSVRDRIVYGELDAAHAPGGLVFSVLCGTHAQPRRVATDLVMNLQGNAITLSRGLWERGVRDARSLKLMVRGEVPKKLAFAVVSPFSSHLILLREWLRGAGVNPDSDVRIVVLPPPLVGEHMREGLIDGFCAGEPWNSAAVLAGEGWIAATSATMSPWHPEKVLMVAEELMRTDEYSLLREAVVKACRWCDASENREALVDLLHECELGGVGRQGLANSLVGPMDLGAGEEASAQWMHCFHRHDANTASKQKAVWYFDGLIEAGSLPGHAGQRGMCLNAFREVTH